MFNVLPVNAAEPSIQQQIVARQPMRLFGNSGIGGGGMDNLRYIAAAAGGGGGSGGGGINSGLDNELNDPRMREKIQQFINLVNSQNCVVRPYQVIEYMAYFANSPTLKTIMTPDAVGEEVYFRAVNCLNEFFNENMDTSKEFITYIVKLSNCELQLDEAVQRYIPVSATVKIVEALTRRNNLLTEASANKLTKEMISHVREFSAYTPIDTNKTRVGISFKVKSSLFNMLASAMINYNYVLVEGNRKYNRTMQSCVNQTHFPSSSDSVGVGDNSRKYSRGAWR